MPESRRNSAFTHLRVLAIMFVPLCGRSGLTLTLLIAMVITISGDLSWGTRSTLMRSVETNFVEYEGLRTHYWEAGKGFPVVLLHSGEFGGCAELSWEWNLPALSRHFRVIAPHWIGFGERAKVFSFDDMISLRIHYIGGLVQKLWVGRAD